MLSLRTLLGLVLLLTTLVSANPTDYTESVDELGWPIWQSESLPGQVFHTEESLIVELSKQKSTKWLDAQTSRFLYSRQIHAEAARRFEQDGRLNESSGCWENASMMDDDDINVEAARFYHRANQWGDLTEVLAELGSDWFRRGFQVMARDPILGRLESNGWSPPNDQRVLQKAKWELKLGNPSNYGPWLPMRLGQHKASTKPGTGVIRLDHLDLELRIEPRSAIEELAADLAGRQGVKEKLGESVKGKAIDCYYFGSGPETVIFFGAFHGDEPESASLMFQFVAHLQAHPELLKDRTAVIVPVVNPDGLAIENRRNANQVDLNRNYPTSNWNSEGWGTDYWGGPGPVSEPETKIVVELLERFQPDRIISVHAPYRCVNFDGPAETLAELLSKENGYKVEPSIGYPTPGSFGTYAGIEKKIPTITLELPPKDKEDVWKDNRRALVKALRGDEAWPALHEDPKSSE